jgi:hypothetical protein
MFTGIMAVLSSICSVIAKIIAAIPWQVWACLIIFLFGGWVFHGGSCRDFACSKYREPKPLKWQELTVSSALTGTSLECRAGTRGRRTRTINLSFIAAPSNAPLSDESRSSLERLAGNVIRIPFQGLFKKPLVNPIKPVSAAPGESSEQETVKCDVCDGTGKILNSCIVACYFCQKDPQCHECNGIGKLKLSYDIVDQCEAAILSHVGDDGCEACQKLNAPCPVLSQRLKEIIGSNSKQPKKIKCFECDGVGKHSVEPVETRLYVGLVYSAYGQCLNTEQVRLGMAKLLPEAPKDWKAFEDEAKKKNLGIWKKAGGNHK